MTPEEREEEEEEEEVVEEEEEEGGGLLQMERERREGERVVGGEGERERVWLQKQSSSSNGPQRQLGRSKWQI